MTRDFLPAAEQVFFDRIVHDLRMRGWSKADAEDAALDRLELRRTVSGRTPNDIGEEG